MKANSELFDWVKASEELSTHMQSVCCRIIGDDHYFTAYWDFSRKVYIVYNLGKSWIPKEEIEWLKKSDINDRLAYGGRKLIGRVRIRHKELKEKEWDWRSFYNGWIEGRMDMLQEVKNIK